MNNESLLTSLLEKLAERDSAPDSARLDAACAGRLPRLLAHLQPGRARRIFRSLGGHLGWVASVILLLVVGLLGFLHRQDTRTIEARQNEIHSLKAEGLRAEDRIRSLAERVEYLEYLLKQLQGLLPAGPITLRDPKVFGVVGPGRDRIGIAGDVNAAYILEVRVRWGIEPPGAFTTLFRGTPEPGPEGKRIPFEGSSPALKLDGSPVVATVEFLPYPGVKDRYPEFFASGQMQYSRKFLLDRAGIRPEDRDEVPAARADLELLSPKEGAKVKESETLEALLKAPDGYPVVFVKSLLPNQPWWVQAPVDEVVNGHFTIEARFGDAVTRPGTRFRIVVVLVKSKEEAQKYQAGDTRLVLPAGLPHSEPVTVVRE
jgi:hypothetical protein